MKTFTLDRKDSAIMSGRGGLPIKNVLYAVFGLFLIYMLYIYHGSQNRLHEAEMTGARYKREAEERVTEIQDLVKGHDKFQEACQKEKHELQNTIKSGNTRYQMLESHQKDTEADLNAMKQHLETMKQEHDEAFTQHTKEYQSLKQEKDNEIARIKDEVADAKRRNEELENSINTLRQQLQAGEVLHGKLTDCETALEVEEGKVAICRSALKTKESSQKTKESLPPSEVDKSEEEGDASKVNMTLEAEGNVTEDSGAAVAKELTEQYKTNLESMNQDISLLQSGRNQLLQENARLQQSLSARQQEQQRPLPHEFQPVPQLPQEHQPLQPQQPVQQQTFRQLQPHFPNDRFQPRDSLNNLGGRNIGGNVFDMKIGMDHMGAKDQGMANVRGQDGELGQVMPPKLHPEGEEEGEDNVGIHKEVNPNDEQKGQILEPFLPNKDGGINNEEDDREDGVIGERDGGGEEGAAKRNAREEEEEREAGVLREEEEDGEGRQQEHQQHQDPLALRQLEAPLRPEGDDTGLRREVEVDEEEMRDRGGFGAGAGVGQKLNREVDQEKFGDNHYFGEAVEEDGPPMEEEDENNEEEEEEEEEQDMENQDDQLGDEQVNEEEEDRRMLPFN